MKTRTLYAALISLTLLFQSSGCEPGDETSSIIIDGESIDLTTIGEPELPDVICDTAIVGYDRLSCVSGEFFDRFKAISSTTGKEIDLHDPDELIGVGALQDAFVVESSSIGTGDLEKKVLLVHFGLYCNRLTYGYQFVRVESFDESSFPPDLTEQCYYVADPEGETLQFLPFGGSTVDCANWYDFGNPGWAYQEYIKINHSLSGGDDWLSYRNGVDTRFVAHYYARLEALIEHNGLGASDALDPVSMATARLRISGEPDSGIERFAHGLCFVPSRHVTGTRRYEHVTIDNVDYPLRFRNKASDLGTPLSCKLRGHLFEG